MNLHINPTPFFSPFEGFKIASWNVELLRLTEDFFIINSPLWQWNISDSVTSSFTTSAVWFVSSDGLIVTIGLFSLFVIWFTMMGDNKKSPIDTSTFFEVVVLFIVVLTFTALGQTSFYYLTTLTLDSNGALSLDSTTLETYLFEFVFNKETMSFSLIFSFFFLLSSGALSNLTLFPKGDLDYFSNGFYNFTLDLFANGLSLKTEKEVQNFQEFFWKASSIFGFVFVANSVGMIPFSTTITSNLMNTFFVALTAFFVVVSTMIIEKGITHFLDLFLPPGTPFLLIPLLVPIEVLSYTFRLVSLAVRLFANMLAGHTLMKVFSGFSWTLLLIGGTTFTLVHYLPVLVLFALTGLELGVAAIQAYVFVVLTLLYIRDIFVGH